MISNPGRDPLADHLITPERGDCTHTGLTGTMQ